MIFISHKDKPDHALALEFRNLLRDLEVETWIAPESVPAGKSYAKEIPAALQRCEKVLCLLTENSVKSEHVFKELDMAIRYNKEVIPVQIGEFTLPSHFEYILSAVQIKQWNEENRDDIISQLTSVAQVYEIPINQESSRKFTLLRGDFQDNVEYALEKDLIDLGKTVLAVGIDRTGNLSISSTSGILRYLCQYLRENFGCGIPQLQQYVDEAKIQQLHHTAAGQPMEFGDTILVKVPVDLSRYENQTADHLQLLLVANSQKSEHFNETFDLDDVNGIDSRDVVLKIFNRCIELGDQADTIIIGAMGTNGLSFPYEVIVAEIMNAYGYATKMGKSPRNLMLSVRNVDMERAGVTSQSIYQYISNIVSFFR